MLNLRSLLRPIRFIQRTKAVQSTPQQLTYSKYFTFFKSKRSSALEDLAITLNKGLSSVRENDIDASITSFKEVIDHFSNNKNISSYNKDELLLLVRTHYELGKSYERKENISEAVEEYTQALSAANKLYTTDTIELGDINNALARVLIKHSSDMKGKAQAHLDTAKHIFRKLAAADKLSPQILENEYMKGMIHGEQGQQDKALEMLEVLSGMLKSRELTFMDTAGGILLYDTTATVHLSLGDIATAEKRWEKAIDLIKKVHGEKSEKLVDVYLSIMQEYLRKGLHERAEENLEEALELCNKEGNEESSKLGECYVAAGSLYFRQNEHNKALDFFDKGLKILERNPNKNQQEVWVAYLTMAEIYLTRSRGEKAEGLFQRAEQIMFRVLGKYQYELGGYYLYWADLLKYKAKDRERAHAYYKKALDACLVSGRVSEPKIIDIYFEIGPEAFEQERYVYSFMGTLQFQQHKYQEGVESFGKAIDAGVKNGEDSHMLIEFSRNLGKILEDKGLVEEAIWFYKKGLGLGAEISGKGQRTELVEDGVRVLTKGLDKLGQVNEVQEILTKLGIKL